MFGFHCKKRKGTIDAVGNGDAEFHVDFDIYKMGAFFVDKEHRTHGCNHHHDKVTIEEKNGCVTVAWSTSEPRRIKWYVKG